MPSYRPHAKISRGSAASSWASAWVNGTPAGVGTTSRPGGSRPGSTPAGPSGGTRSSRASPQGSGRITMPGPPPYGVSSTVRCTSCVHRRRSWTATSSTPAERARPMSDRSSGLRYSGKIVTMSTLMCRPSQFEQARWRGQYDPPARDVNGRHDRADERYERLPPVGHPHHEQVGGRPVVDADDLTQRCAVHVHHGEADQLEVVELVGIVGLADLGRVDAQPDPARLLGAVAVHDALERDDQPALVWPYRLDPQRLRALPAGRPRAGLSGGGQLRPGGEARRRVVRRHLDHDLATDTVWPDDLADDQLHTGARVSTRRRCRPVPRDRRST